MISASGRYISFTLKLVILSFTFLQFSCRKENFDLYVYPDKSASIKELIIDCASSSMPQMKNFWIRNMKCKPLNTDSSSIQVGETKLTLKKNQNGALYQFSINIPENQIENAYDWIKKNTSSKIIVSSETGAEIIHKPKFNAHAIYFRDPAGNIVELIARHDLKNSFPGTFEPASMLQKISDVTIITRSLKSSANILSNTLGLQELPGTTNAYKPLGGLNGLITLMVPGKPFPPSEEIIAPMINYGKMEIIIQHPVSIYPLLLPGSNTIIRTEP